MFHYDFYNITLQTEFSIIDKNAKMKKNPNLTSNRTPNRNIETLKNHQVFNSTARNYY